MSKPTIALIVYDLEGGGAERVVANLSQSFALHHPVDIIVFNTSASPYPYSGRLISLDCPASEYLPKQIINLLGRAIKLYRQLHCGKYSHIYAFMESANFPALLASSNIVISVRNNPHKFGLLTRLAMKVLYPRARKVVAVSAAVADILRSKFHLQNVTYIHNPLNLEKIETLKKLPIHYTRPYLLAMGRLHPQKGFDLLITAYACCKTSQTVDLLIFGEGPYRYRLQQQIEHLGLSGKVHLMGITDNPYCYLANAQLFILSSRYEGYPNVLIEALACQCPVIATNCPTGPNEIIKHGVNGILVENENADELSKAIDYLMKNPTLREKFRQQGRNAVQHLKLDTIAQQWLEL